MAEPAIDEQWVNQPQQARSKETMNRFVLAAERLLRDKPFDDITIGEIVEGAERTVGSFYARFDDKWALLRTVIHRYLQQIRDFLDDLLTADEWANHSFSEMVRVTSHATVGLYRAHGHIFRAGLAFAATDEDARAGLLEHYSWVRERIARAVLTHPEIQATPALERRIHLSLEACGAVLDTRLLFSDAWRNGKADWDKIACETEALFTRMSGLGGLSPE